MTTYQQELQRLKLYGKQVQQKKRYTIPKKSQRKIAAEKAEKEARGDNGLDMFFEWARKKMVGVCQCGCAKKSSKNEDDYYRCSICHIFPKRIFKSIANHELNWVERNFWDGCHSNMDNQSMDKWVNMADWDDIKEKYYQLTSLVTDEERKHKFYTHLEKLVYG